MSLEDKLADLLKQIESATQAIAPMQAKHEELKAAEGTAYQEYQAKVAALRNERSSIDEAIYEVNKQVNQAKYEAEKLQREIEEAKAKAEAERKAQEYAAELENLYKRWDTLTIGAPWREFAMDHQISAGHHLTENQKVILADPMGLGKTLSSILTLDIVQAATKGATPEFPFLGKEVEENYYVPAHYDSMGEWVQGEYKTSTKIKGGVERPCGIKVLYLCPTALLRNVIREFERWSPHRNIILAGQMTKAERGFIFEHVIPNQDNYVVICNMEAWRKDTNLLKQLIACDFDTVIIDEAHNAKEMKSNAYRGVRTILQGTNANFVFPMTGTPVLNRPQELFSLLTMVDPDNFYNLNSFLGSYCQQTEAGTWTFKPGGLDQLFKRMGNRILRRTKEQAGIKLPEKTIINHDLEVDKEAYPHQDKVREQMRKHAMIMLDEAEGKAITAAAMIAVFTRLRQIETWPAGIVIRDPLTKEPVMQVDVEESQKMDYIIHYDKESNQFEGLLPEIVEDERVIIFSQFKAPLRELADRIGRAGYRAAVLDGDTPSDERDRISMDFDAKHTPNREDAKYDVLLCNYRVGGVGHNFTAASQMIILDEEWNPGKRDQAYDRIHRIGQEKPVTIHLIRNQKTIDDWLAGIMDTKQQLVDGLENKMISAAEFKEALDSGLL